MGYWENFYKFGLALVFVCCGASVFADQSLDVVHDADLLNRSLQEFHSITNEYLQAIAKQDPQAQEEIGRRLKENIVSWKDLGNQYRKSSFGLGYKINNLIFTLARFGNISYWAYLLIRSHLLNFSLHIAPLLPLLMAGLKGTCLIIGGALALNIAADFLNPKNREYRRMIRTNPAARTVQTATYMLKRAEVDSLKASGVNELEINNKLFTVENLQELRNHSSQIVFEDCQSYIAAVAMVSR